MTQDEKKALAEKLIANSKLRLGIKPESRPHFHCDKCDLRFEHYHIRYKKLDRPVTAYPEDK